MFGIRKGGQENGCISPFHSKISGTPNKITISEHHGTATVSMAFELASFSGIRD